LCREGASDKSSLSISPEKIQKFGDKMYAMVDRKFRDAMQIVNTKKWKRFEKANIDGSEDRIRRFCEIYFGTHMGFGIYVAIQL
jgi:hypothetical protein